MHKSETLTIQPTKNKIPSAIFEETDFFNKKLPIGNKRTCHCGPTHINCMTAKEWLKSQLGVWQFIFGRHI